MNVPLENIQGKAQATNPMLSTNTESNSSLQSDQLKALAVMKDNLPEYIVESFIEAGFDTLDVISQIDTPTLEEIEQFITREFVEDVRFKRGFGVTGQFKFLPGHRRQINMFITKVKEEAISKELKWHAQSQRASTKAPAEIQSCNASLKRRKVDVDSSLSPVSESSSSTDKVLSSIRPENQATVMAKIRQQIVKWQRQHSTDKVAKLKETEHFDVKVDVIGKDNLSLSIICNICGKRCILSSNKEHIFLSNWTRHVIKCVEKVKMPLSNMVKIKDYFRPLSNPLASPLVLQSEGKRVPLMLSPVESLCDKSVANLPSSISKNDSLSVSENPVLFDGPPCLRKNKSTGGSNDSKENSLSLDACNYSQQSIESSLSVSNNQVDINEKSTQLSVSTDESQGFLDASLSTQVIPQATQSQVIPFNTEYQSPTGSVILNKEENYCDESRRDFKDTLTSNDDTKVKPHTDWSRSTRNKLLLLKAGSHHNQTKLTSFFDLVDDVSSIMSKLPAFETGSMPLTQDYVPTKFQDMFSPLFKRLIANAETNLQKLPQQIRYDTIIKKFATSLLIYCGPMSYNFISSNLSKALPCLRTVQRSIAKEYALFQEGHFRFDELLDHLKHFNASMVVSVGEDATRVISRIEYDSETDKLVGFVLPCDQDGLPICDSFVATSFETMEKYFHNASLAKYAFVYVVQPLTKGVPPFCLACVGTNNKFNAEIVMKRWQYIHDQLNQRGIHLVSIGADGDSRELRGMLVSTQLLTSVQSSSNTSFLIDKIVIPPEWNSWFAMKRPTSVAFVQDMVHIAVKLKTRLLKPSIILPLGNYVAGVHHLRIVQQTFCKDQHGLRERDINYKDKQNYDAVVRMTSESVMNLLTSVPDAKGTIAYLTIMKYINDSFLDKTLECLCRIEKAWYVVFVVRYWRQWIVRHTDYSIANNFISSNTYMCIELNAHSLLIHILSLQNLLPPSSENFLPWLLGSQCCERLFRSARSMSSTFSTIINFSILGFMRRLHRLQLQVKLESECDVTTIKYPRAEAHKSKDSQCKSSICKPHLVTTQDITRTVENARELAKSTIQDLGMADLLKAHEDWNNPPIPGHTVDVEDGDQEDDDDGDNDEVVKDCVADLLEVNSTVEPDDVSAGITRLSDAKLIDENMADHLKSLHAASFRKVSNSGLPVYEMEVDSSTKRSHKSKFCPFVEVSHNKKKVFIHKTTAVWLLQEGERVSTDRLFRVRIKQPFSIDSKPKASASVSVAIPIVGSTVDIGNVCIFKGSDTSESVKIGRLLKFAYYLEKKKGSQQYRGLTAKVDEKKVGVLCTWYAPCDSSPRKYSLVKGNITNDYVPITTYLCTLLHECFENFDNINIPPAINASYNVKNAQILASQHLVLTEAAAMNVVNLLQDSNASGVFKSNNTRKLGTSAQIVVLDDRNTTNHCKSVSGDQWVKCGRISLTKKDKQHILLDKELLDLHVNAFHSIARTQFPLVGGLYNTLVLKNMSFTKDGCDHEHTQSLQIIHIKERSHWAAIQLVKSELYLYDSYFSSACTETLELLAQLVKTRQSCLIINIMNVHKQIGTTDCGLFAIATVTCLLFDGDPTTVVFDQDALRQHFVKILETNVITLFPTLQTRRPAERISRVQSLQVFCICRLLDTAGDEMVSCDHCEEWFHLSCLNMTESPSTEKWFCSKCLRQNDPD